MSYSATQLDIDQSQHIVSDGPRSVQLIILIVVVHYSVVDCPLHCWILGLGLGRSLQ